MTNLDLTENYFHIDNKRILLITIKQIITSVQIRYNLFYERANKLHVITSSRTGISLSEKEKNEI